MAGRGRPGLEVKATHLPGVPLWRPASLNFPSLVVGLEVHSPHPTLFL